MLHTEQSCVKSLHKTSELDQNSRPTALMCTVQLTVVYWELRCRRAVQVESLGGAVRGASRFEKKAGLHISNDGRQILHKADQLWRSYFEIGSFPQFTLPDTDSNTEMKCKLSSSRTDYRDVYATRAYFDDEAGTTKALNSSQFADYFVFRKKELWSCYIDSVGLIRVVNEIIGRKEIFKVIFPDGVEVFTRSLRPRQRTVIFREIKYLDLFGIPVRYDGWFKFADYSVQKDFFIPDCKKYQGANPFPFYLRPKCVVEMNKQPVAITSDNYFQYFTPIKDELWVCDGQNNLQVLRLVNEFLTTFEVGSATVYSEVVELRKNVQLFTFAIQMQKLNILLSLELIIVCD
ncbi:hypothetical protein LSTR_LSTR010174 [Laodelphax striatellus]|uniref:Uncharacterized protein n=1 Tax=Laodelphax striatellus TaxID=195883 RepID=A0A482XLP6_LAOST|nr:hypothetical protein LSTR_LSTR010174 [Laodelphax striatellus]